jgi:hypothetical protein
MRSYVKNCFRCKGTRKIQYAATIKDAKGRTIAFWLYDAECPRCRGAELWLEGICPRPPTP